LSFDFAGWPDRRPHAHISLSRRSKDAFYVDLGKAGGTGHCGPD
jgi:hypothetical protein